MIAIKRLEDREIRDILKKAWNGALSLVDIDRPYTIPIAYVFYRDSLYFILIGEGRKTRCFKKNKNVCYLIFYEVSEDHYSILIEGVLEKVSEEALIREVIPLFYNRKEIVKDLGLTEQRCKEIVDMSLKNPNTGLFRLVPDKISGMKKRLI